MNLVDFNHIIPIFSHFPAPSITVIMFPLLGKCHVQLLKSKCVLEVGLSMKRYIETEADVKHH